MKKLMAVVVAGLLFVPMLAGPTQAWAGGGGWHGGGGGWHGGGWHGGGWHGHGGGGCCWGWGWGGFAAGVGIGALATAPLWYGPAYAYPYPAYPYPAYPAYSYPAYPAYSYPTYSYPTTPPPAYPPPTDSGVAPQTGQSATVNYGGAPAPPTPAAQQAPAGNGQNCQTLTVDGHNETRTLQNGQTLTVWIPTYTQQVCQ